MNSMRKALGRVWRSKSAVIGIVIIVALTAGAIFAPVLARFDPEEMQMASRLHGPSGDHWLGTDEFGRDMYSRILYGARISLTVAFAAVSISTVIGVTIGLISGYFGGVVDLLVQRIVDIFLAFPVLLLSIALVAALGPNPRNVILAIGLVNWTTYTRVVRADVLTMKEREFVEAARVIGVSDWRIMVHHILPNVLSPLIVLATLGLGYAIVAEAALSFLGLGVQPPRPSWGWTVSFGTRFLRDAPHLSTFAGLAIMIAVLGFNLLGDGLRDLLDPQSRQR
jgi:peptide/nickel transport system permease protein